MANDHSSASRMDKMATAKTASMQRRVSYKSVKKVKLGCRSGSSVGKSSGVGSAPDSDHGRTSYRWPIDREKETKAITENLHSQSGFRTHEDISEKELRFLSGDATRTSTHNSKINLEKTKLTSTDILLRNETKNDIVEDANTEQEIARFGSELDDGQVRTSTIVKTMQVYGDSNERCLQPLLDPIQDTIRASLLKYSQSCLPADAHQHITNEVTVTLEGDRIIIIVNINCTLFAEDTMLDPGQAGLEEDITAAGLEENITSAGFEEDITTAGVEENITSAGLEEDITAAGLEEDITSAGLEEDITAAGLEDITAAGRQMVDIAL